MPLAASPPICLGELPALLLPGLALLGSELAGVGCSSADRLALLLLANALRSEWRRPRRRDRQGPLGRRVRRRGRRERRQHALRVPRVQRRQRGVDQARLLPEALVDMLRPRRLAVLCLGCSGRVGEAARRLLAASVVAAAVVPEAGRRARQLRRGRWWR